MKFMTNLSIGTVRDYLSKLLFCIAILIAAAGVFIFYFISTRSLLLRGAVLLFFTTFAFFIASFSSEGNAFLLFSKESVNEVSKIIWPSKKETAQSTFVVFGFVSVMAIYLCLTDKLIEWFIFSLILDWR